MPGTDVRARTVRDGGDPPRARATREIAVVTSGTRRAPPRGMTKLGLVLIAALAACKAKQPPPAAGDGTGSPVAGSQVARSQGAGSQGAGSQAAPAAEQGAGHNMTGLRPHQAENCPSSLPNATTRLANTPRGVDVTMTSSDAPTARRIVELAQLHVRGRTAEASHPHDQKHGGPGWIGYCPVVVTDETQVSITPLPDGATVHVEARSPSRVTELQQLVKARAVRLPGYLSS